MAVQDLSRSEARKLAEMEAALEKKFNMQGPLSTNSFSIGNKSIDQVRPKPPLVDRPKVDLGPEYIAPYANVGVRESLPFNPDNNRNMGYGPKGNVFPTSAEQRADLDRIYGGTGSANAAAMQQRRDRGEEGFVARTARERQYPDRPQPRKSYNSFAEFFGK
jgi:hypothetical protein